MKHVFVDILDGRLPKGSYLAAIPTRVPGSDCFNLHRIALRVPTQGSLWPEGDAVERLLCPVGALKHYLEVTKSFSPRPRNLFVSVRAKTCPLSWNALCFFMRETVRLSRLTLGEDALPSFRVRTHSFRGPSGESVHLTPWMTDRPNRPSEQGCWLEKHSYMPRVFTAPGNIGGCLSSSGCRAKQPRAS
ncbi:hypothetical protein GWK47_000842 [Chionoecetes opilio]|uniref:Uncharacterized protein n=1 Tax=Chionoecetes opilio TaxID=41210 RepID=A0A8J5CQB6_CHIOP|nr:hypothetical protein GWK47_000842 [Chionoecetes opilio]